MVTLLTVYVDNLVNTNFAFSFSVFCKESCIHNLACELWTKMCCKLVLPPTKENYCILQLPTVCESRFLLDYLYILPPWYLCNHHFISPSFALGERLHTCLFAKYSAVYVQFASLPLSVLKINEPSGSKAQRNSK